MGDQESGNYLDLQNTKNSADAQNTLDLENTTPRQNQKNIPDSQNSLDSPTKIPATIIYCVRDSTGRVNYQNTTCKTRCGEMEGVLCSSGCNQYLKMAPRSQGNLGIKVASHVEMGGDKFDIALVTTESQAIVIALPIETDIKQQKKELLEHGLTEREIEVGHLVIEGCSNRQIAKKLHIAHSTVKKHLYSIYGKIPKSKLVRR